MEKKLQFPIRIMSYRTAFDYVYHFGKRMEWEKSKKSVPGISNGEISAIIKVVQRWIVCGKKIGGKLS